MTKPANFPARKLERQLLVIRPNGLTENDLLAISAARNVKTKKLVRDGSGAIICSQERAYRRRGRLG